MAMTALLIIDCQNDFLEDGALGARETSDLVPALNRVIAECSTRKVPLFFTRDWHPVNHYSFRSEGGIWPPHCVQNTAGARFAEGLTVPVGATVVSKGQMVNDDGYSMFENTSLKEQLQKLEVRELAVCGIATEYCVLESVKDALQDGYKVAVLMDLVRSIEATPGDSFAALDKMRTLGAALVKSEKWLANLQRLQAKL